jgi:archaellin
METVYGLILALFLVFCVFSTGCIGEDTPPPAPIGGSNAQEGVLIQNIGDVTGQGVIFQGVPHGTVDTITFTIGLAPGVKTVELNNLTIAYADAVRTEILKPVEGYRGNPPPGDWGIITVVNELGYPNMRLDDQEQFIIRINPKAAVVPNQVVTISVKPRVGKPLLIRRVAPSTIFENDNILTVL